MRERTEAERVGRPMKSNLNERCEKLYRRLAERLFELGVPAPQPLAREAMRRWVAGVVAAHADRSPHAVLAAMADAALAMLRVWHQQDSVTELRRARAAAEQE